MHKINNKILMNEDVIPALFSLLSVALRDLSFLVKVYIDSGVCNNL